MSSNYQLSFHLDPCNINNADIGFIIDSSKHYEEEKYFLKKIAVSFKLKYQNVRTSVITFRAYTNIKLYEHTDRETDFDKALEKIPYMSLTERMDKALKQVKSEMFTTQNRAREGVHKILVLLTDGTQTGEEALFPVVTTNELRKNGVLIVVVGIGNLIDLEEIKELAGSAGKYVIASSFDELVTFDFINTVAKGSCSGKSYA